MRKIISIILASVMLLSAFSVTAFASGEEVLESGVVEGDTELKYTPLKSGQNYSKLKLEQYLYETAGENPESISLSDSYLIQINTKERVLPLNDDTLENQIKEDYIQSSSNDLSIDKLSVEYYGTLSDGSMLVYIDGPFSYATVPNYRVIGNYVYVTSNSGNEIVIYKDHNFTSILESYLNGDLTEELLDETAEIMCFAKFIGEIDVKEKLEKLSSIVYNRLYSVDDQKPYTEDTFERLEKSYQFAENLINSQSSTNDNYQIACNLLESAIERTYIKESYAKATYVLSLEEQNDNGWYEEADWNDFVQKREALRDSFKTEDTITISNAYFGLYDSFINMTSKYTVAGDVNKDGVVNVLDVTEIQKALVGYTELNGAQKMLINSIGGDTYMDYDSVSVLNATAIEKYIAGYDVKVTSKTVPFEAKDCFDVSYNYIICMRFNDPRYSWVNDKIQELEEKDVI